MANVNSPQNKDDSEEDFHNTHRPTENLKKIELIGTNLRVNYDGASMIATTSHRVNSIEEKAEIRLQEYISVCENRRRQRNIQHRQLSPAWKQQRLIKSILMAAKKTSRR